MSQSLACKGLGDLFNFKGYGKIEGKLQNCSECAEILTQASAMMSRVRPKEQ